MESRRQRQWPRGFSSDRVLIRQCCAGRRRAEPVTAAAPDEAGSWWLTIDLQFEAPPKSRVVLGKTPFGPIGVRMAKTIGVTDGGGRILNSAGQRNEAEVFHKPARWVDYSGPITRK